MPCWTVQTSTTEFNGKTDIGLLKKTLEGLGYIVDHPKYMTLVFRHPSTGASGTFQDNELTMVRNTDTNLVKRAYSGEVVKFAAAKFGWKVQEKTPGTFQVTRRS